MRLRQIIPVVGLLVALIAGCAQSPPSAVAPEIPTPAVETQSFVEPPQEVPTKPELPSERLVVVANNNALAGEFPTITILDADSGAFVDSWTFDSVDEGVSFDDWYVRYNGHFPQAWRAAFARNYTRVVAIQRSNDTEGLKTRAGYVSLTGEFTDVSRLAPPPGDFSAVSDSMSSFSMNGDMYFARRPDSSGWASDYVAIFLARALGDTAVDMTPEGEGEVGYTLLGARGVVPKASGNAVLQTNDDGSKGCYGAHDVSEEGMCVRILHETELHIKPAATGEEASLDEWGNDRSTNLLPPDSNRVLSSAMFSPDGQTIIFAAGKPESLGVPITSFDLFKISVNGGEPVKLEGQLHEGEQLIDWIVE